MIVLPGINTYLGLEFVKVKTTYASWLLFCLSSLSRVGKTTKN